MPPHVQAARKAEACRLENQLPAAYANGGWTESVITLTGPEPLEMRLTNYDYEYYIERQIEPVVDGILPFLDDSFANLTQQQMGLFQLLRALKLALWVNPLELWYEPVLEVQ